MEAYFFFLFAVIFGWFTYSSHLAISRRTNHDGSLRINAEEGETFYEIRRLIAYQKKDRIVATVHCGMFTAVWLYIVLH